MAHGPYGDLVDGAEIPHDVAGGDPGDETVVRPLVAVDEVGGARRTPHVVHLGVRARVHAARADPVVGQSLPLVAVPRADAVGGSWGGAVRPRKPLITRTRSPDEALNKHACSDRLRRTGSRPRRARRWMMHQMQDRRRDNRLGGCCNAPCCQEDRGTDDRERRRYPKPPGPPNRPRCTSPAGGGHSPMLLPAPLQHGTQTKLQACLELAGSFDYPLVSCGEAREAMPRWNSGRAAPRRTHGTHA